MSDNLEHARQNAEGWLGSIQEMVARLEHASECDDPECGNVTRESQIAVGVASEYEDGLEDYHDADAAREAIEESVLSVMVNGSWTPGATPEATGYEILLSTGGPALRIVGTLRNYGQPADARLEMQDWGTRWETYCYDEPSVLKFASQFWFGD